MYVACLVSSILLCALAQEPPAPPTGFPNTFYSWVVVTITKPGIKQPFLIEGQLIAFDKEADYAARYQEQNLINTTTFRPADYCDGTAGYHYAVEDATGVTGLNPPCNSTIPLPGPMLSPQYPKDFLDNAKFLGIVKVNQKNCNHFYAPSVRGNGTKEFQMDLFSDSDGMPCQISTQTMDNPPIITTWAFDGFGPAIPGGLPLDVPKLLCAERTWTCQTNPKATPSSLQAALGWVCGVEDCSPINPGGAHYYPNTLKDHCDWAFNNYYMLHRLEQGSGACNFSGNAILAPDSNSTNKQPQVRDEPPPDYPSLFPLYLVC